MWKDCIWKMAKYDFRIVANIRENFPRCEKKNVFEIVVLFTISSYLSRVSAFGKYLLVLAAYDLRWHIPSDWSVELKKKSYKEVLSSRNFRKCGNNKFYVWWYFTLCWPALFRFFNVLFLWVFNPLTGIRLKGPY